MGKDFSSVEEEYNYYMTTFPSKLTDEEKPEWDEILYNRDKYMKEESKYKFPVAELRKVNQKLEEKERILNSIFSSSTKKYEARKFSIIKEMQGVYYRYFKKYYCKKENKVVQKFRERFAKVEHYIPMLKEQKYYEEYLNLKQKYIAQNDNKMISDEFRNDIFQIILLKDELFKDKCVAYLERRFKEKFNEERVISESCLDGFIEDFYYLCLKEEQKHPYQKKPKKKKVITYDDDSDDDIDDNNYHYHTSYNYNSHSSSSHSSNSNSINNNNRSNNSSKNAGNKKKRVKVIMCYACKGKDKCPLCGDKITSRVSLGNLYAHSDCYNEGTCCLCNKKGSGNQVQSICSNCRKNGSGKGLSGSAKCFVCRKLL